MRKCLEEAGCWLGRGEDEEARLQFESGLQSEGETGESWFPVHQRPAGPEPGAAERG